MSWERKAFHMIIFSTLSGYFASRWWMMLVVSLNQIPSMLSRTNGTWRRRVAMSNQGHSHLNLNLALEIINLHLRSASLLFQSTQLSQAGLLSPPLETLQAEPFDQDHERQDEDERSTSWRKSSRTRRRPGS